MLYVVVVAELLIGLAYTGLGVLTTYELLHERRSRGFSQFGAAFALMAFTCGPHHLLRAADTLAVGAAPPAGLVISLLLALPAGLIFVGLRVEVLTGGPGDRTLHNMPALVTMLSILVAAAAGAIIVAALRGHRELHLPFAISNTIQVVAYLLVGWYILDTQIRRYAATKSWSLSGIALGFIFPTCAVAHLTHVVAGHAPTAHQLMGHVPAASPTSWANLLVILDIIGLPASLWFLVVVRRLYRAGLDDWNRRPLVGTGLLPRRVSPWRYTLVDDAR